MEGRHDIGKGGGQALLVKAGGSDGHHHVSQLPHGLAEFRCRRPHGAGHLAHARPFRLGRGRGQGEGVAGQGLHDPVMEVGGDVAAFDRARLDGPVQEPLLLLPAPLKAAGHRPGDRDLHEEEQGQAGQECGRDRRHGAATLGRHRGHAQVGLEQHRRPAGRAHAVVDLEQLVEGLLMGVLGLGEIGDVGQRGAAQEGGSLGGAEREALADERRVV